MSFMVIFSPFEMLFCGGFYPHTSSIFSAGGDILVENQGVGERIRTGFILSRTPFSVMIFPGVFFSG